MKLNSIQVLRGIAAILVTYEHSMNLQISFSKSFQQSFFHLHNFGCIGVDLFFVISGFIMFYVASKYFDQQSGVSFLSNRFLRINPIYYIASFIFVGIVILEGELFHGQQITLKRFCHGLIDTFLIFPTSSEMRGYLPFQIAGWTLCFEWLFYLILFLLIITKANKRTIFMLIILIFLLLTIVGRTFSFSDFRLVTLTNPIILEFSLGILILQIYLRAKLSSAISYFFLALGLILYALLIMYGFGDIWSFRMVMNGKSSLSRFIMWGVPSAFIVMGCVGLENNYHLQKLWRNKLLQTLGDASFSIYLIHPIILALFNIVYLSLGFFIDPDLSIIIQLGTALTFGVLFYKYIEKPFINYYKKIGKKATQPSLQTL